jgi:hypothetical protein
MPRNSQAYRHLSAAETTHRKRVVTVRTLSVTQAISAPPEESLLARLNRYFETAVADTPESFAIRRGVPSTS